MFVCEKGPRSYEAARIFLNYGYKNISYLGGGIAFFREVNKYFENYPDANKEINNRIDVLN